MQSIQPPKIIHLVCKTDSQFIVCRKDTDEITALK